MAPVTAAQEHVSHAPDFTRCNVRSQDERNTPFFEDFGWHTRRRLRKGTDREAARRIDCWRTIAPLRQRQGSCSDRGQATAEPCDRRPAAAGGYISHVRPEMARRSEEHTSELQSLMRISSAVFCLKKKKT